MVKGHLWDPAAWCPAGQAEAFCVSPVQGVLPAGDSCSAWSSPFGKSWAVSAPHNTRMLLSGSPLMAFRSLIHWSLIFKHVQAAHLFVRHHSFTVYLLLLTGLSWAYLETQLQANGVAEDGSVLFYENWMNQGPFCPAGPSSWHGKQWLWAGTWVGTGPVTAGGDSGFPLWRQERPLCVWDLARPILHSLPPGHLN